MTHYFHLPFLDVLHLGSDPSWQGVERKHRHHANNRTPSEYFVQEHNAQDDLEG